MIARTLRPRDRRSRNGPIVFEHACKLGLEGIVSSAFRIAFDHPHQCADLPITRLLRARRKRPRRRAAEKANEFTSPHIRTQAQGPALYRLKRVL
jgi:hypothetical protein